MVPPYGDDFAERSTSTWIHWKSPVACAKRSMRSWPMIIQSVTQTSLPTWRRTSSPSSKRVADIMLDSSSRVRTGRDEWLTQCAPAIERDNDTGDGSEMGGEREDRVANIMRSGQALERRVRHVSIEEALVELVRRLGHHEARRYRDDAYFRRKCQRQRFRERVDGGLRRTVHDVAADPEAG